MKKDYYYYYPSVYGYRIVDISYFIKSLINLQHHPGKKCTSGMLIPFNEEQDGLLFAIIFECNLCEKEVRKYTEDPNKKIMNTACVWGTLATGSTFSHTEELFSVMNIPMMSYRKFNEIQT